MCGSRYRCHTPSALRHELIIAITAEKKWKTKTSRANRPMIIIGNNAEISRLITQKRIAGHQLNAAPFHFRPCLAHAYLLINQEPFPGKCHLFAHCSYYWPQRAMDRSETEELVITAIAHSCGIVNSSAVMIRRVAFPAIHLNQFKCTRTTPTPNVTLLHCPRLPVANCDFERD